MVNVHNDTKANINKYLIFAHHMTRKLHGLLLVGEEKHMPFVRIQRIFLTQAQAALEGTTLVVLIPDLNRFRNETSKLGGDSGGAGIEELHAGMDRTSDGHRCGGFFGHGQGADMAMHWTKGIIVHPFLNNHLRITQLLWISICWKLMHLKQPTRLLDEG